MPHFDHFPRPGEMDPYAFRFISNASVFVPEPHPFTRSEIPLELSSAIACLEWRGGSSWEPPFCIFPLIFLKWWCGLWGGQWAHNRKSTWPFRYAPLWLIFLSRSLICQTRNFTCPVFLIKNNTLDLSCLSLILGSAQTLAFNRKNATLAILGTFDCWWWRFPVACSLGKVCY